MKSILKFGTYLLLLAMLACASGKDRATVEEKAAFDKMISEKHFQIESTWAQPMASQSMNAIASAGLLPPGSTANRIDITGNNAYLRMVGDSVMADLPFFGERRMGGYYDQNKTGIKFKGIPENLTFSPTKNGEGQTMQFNIRHESENYQVFAQLYPKGMARLTVSSTHRTNIWYQGNLSEYKEE